MAQRTTRSRAAAVRAAREARAQAVAARLERERRIEAALADFFEGTDAAAEIRSDARERADTLLAAAEERAKEGDALAARAVRELRSLEQTNAEIANLCGISVSTVRAMANERDEDADADWPEAREATGPAASSSEGADSDPWQPVTSDANTAQPGGLADSW